MRTKMIMRASTTYLRRERLPAGFDFLKNKIIDGPFYGPIVDHGGMHHKYDKDRLFRGIKVC